ncbi:MAG: MBL fold metallo-hydrolase [Acidobacteriaceae bacterium]|nr:MBL fold metallo-hydrolase [Acidobacteriaceae bacterium]
MNATLTFFGTGTSMGVPTLGCTCAVCTDAYTPGSPNRRTRASALLRYNGHNVLIDTGQDFHVQAVRERLMRLDAVLYTHGHADHVLGMDDLRPLSFGKPQGLPLYADDATAQVIERIFDYTFRKVDRYPTSARVEMNRLSTELGTTLELFGATIERIPVTHGRNTIAGYRIGSCAYLTDMSDIPEPSRDRLQNLDILILDALRREPHPSHAHLDKAVELVELLKPRRAFFTHISHDLDHNTVNAELPPHIQLAHDGLTLEFSLASFPAEAS